MATTTRPTSPQSAAPQFSSKLDTTPRTSTLLPSVSSLPPVTEEPELSSGLRPPSSYRLAPVPVDGLAKTDHRAFSPRVSPIPLTGIAAMAELKRSKQQQYQHQHQSHSPRSVDSRQTTPNPAVEAMQTLMGGGGMSRPTDAPAPDKLSEPLRRAAEKIHVPDNNSQTDSDQISPVSLGSLGTADSSTGAGSALTATTSKPLTASEPQFVAEPAQMTDAQPRYQEHDDNAEQSGNKAFSYPGPRPPAPDAAQQGTPSAGPSRGMSLPGYGQSSPRSPVSNKRHKCPYCATDFTRHHNLKSHLLTHSQEKPFVCQTCQARFRRLHDLKRHTKLHTGERPHTCDKCGRKFARGDALARHNKGPGGCAGRRSSYGGDDDYSGDGADKMDLEYTGPDDDDDDGTDPSDAHSRDSSRKKQQLETPTDNNRQIYRQHSRTYPPGPRALADPGGMAPPSLIHTGPNSNAAHDSQGSLGGSSSSNMPSGYYSQGQLFSEPGAMTSSPKPISPGQAPDQHRLSVPDGSSGGNNIGRNRSVSLNTQLAHSHVSSINPDSHGRTPPLSNTPFPPSSQQSNTLPPLNASNPNLTRPGQPPIIGGPGLTQPQQHIQLTPAPNITNGNSNGNGSGGGAGRTASNPGSLSSHGQSSGSSMRDIIGMDPSEIWKHFHQLEQRFTRMQDEYELRISRLQEDVISLKGQVANALNYNNDMPQRVPY